MVRIFLLVRGYVKDNGKKVQATVSLIQDGNKNIIVDPGMTKNPQAITQALKAHGLAPKDIDYVIITHHHPDHTRHMGLFSDATLVDFASKYATDNWIDLPKNFQVTLHVKTVQTPGHTPEDITVVVSDITNIDENKKVTVGICHLWWYEGKEDDPTAKDFKQLQDSRKKILKMVDYVVPGHGDIFKV